MSKKGSKPPSRAKEPAQRIKATGSAKKPGKGPSIPDLTDALAVAMARLKAAQIPRLLGHAIPAGLPDHAESCQEAAGGRKAGKVRKEAGKAGKQSGKPKKRALKGAGQANLTREPDPQLDDSGTRLRKAA